MAILENIKEIISFTLLMLYKKGRSYNFILNSWEGFLKKILIKDCVIN
jgi:hypothetical protein